MGNQQAISEKDLHRKMKGNIGQLAIATDLAKKGYCVFSEMGDLSKTDLIAIVNGVPILIQVKYRAKSSNGTLEILFGKSGPNYRYMYTKDDFDVIAVYCPDNNMCLYISNKELERKGSVYIRIDRTKQGQEKKVRYFTEFLSFERALRDYTPRTLPSNVGGGEIVQTTTPDTISAASES